MNSDTEFKGRVERAAGELKDDDQLKRDGEIDKTSGKLKDKLDDAVDKVKDVLHRDDR